VSELGNHGEPIVVLARDLCVMEGAEWSGLLWRSHFCLEYLMPQSLLSLPYAPPRAPPFLHHYEPCNAASRLVD